MESNSEGKTQSRPGGQVEKDTEETLQNNTIVGQYSFYPREVHHRVSLTSIPSKLGKDDGRKRVK